ncbi:MAG: hypothetical protein CVV27_00655 [Candidatus Melainabacteria bacterium HGW-Melainabacteria-1]|nr:MAG: hypothetical protein CVV27_00655 [Candidatus Melainabacteria bacterium HGW-Melainabacteria-1]
MNFSGRFADFSLPDVLRILIQSQKQGNLVVRYQNSESRVFVNRGALHHAESEGLKGEKAVYNMLNFDHTAEFEFIERSEIPPQTIHSDLDTLIQNGISYLETWRKIFKRQPRFSVNTEILIAPGFPENTLTGDETQILTLLPPDQREPLHQLIEHTRMDPVQLVETLLILEQKGYIQILTEKRMELRQFFLEMANTLLQEFDSISGLKLKQEMTERLDKLIQENNWKIEIQNGRIVDDKMHSSSLQEQTELYSLCLNHLITIITPIYGSTFLQQVMNKVEQRLSGSVQHWVRELKLEL